MLVAVLFLAALLRLTGLDQGVRRGSPAGDEEHNFVTPVRAMWAKPTVDPGVRPGYPGFFNDLALLPVVLGDRLDGEMGAYVGGRGLVAVFGVVNVLLVFLLCRALAGPWPGLFAAGLMAVSRGEIVHAHFITPDLVVISGVLGVLLAVRRSPLDARRIAFAGVLCGLTIAVKYTGVVVMPALVVALVRDRAPWRHYAVAALAAVASFALAAPFALLGTSPEVGGGVAAALRDYYSPTGYAGMTARTAEYAGATSAGLAAAYVRQNVPGLALGLAAAGLVLFRPLASIAPLLAALVTGVAMTLPAQIVYPRHVLVPSALVIVLAGCGLRAVLDRLPRGRAAQVGRVVLAVVAAPAVVPAARTAFALAARFYGPDGLDQAGTWLEKNVPGRPLVAAGYPRFALADRFEVRYWVPPNEPRVVDVPVAVLQQYDVVLAPAADLDALGRQGLRYRSVRAFGDDAAAAFPERPLAMAVVPSRVDASDAPAGAAGAWAGSSPWRSADPTGWISGEWDPPRHIVRVDLVSDSAGGFTPQGILVEGRDQADGKWRRLHVWPLRPLTLSRQDPATRHGQIFVLDPPADLAGIRIVGRGSSAWGLSRNTVLADPGR